MAKKVSDSDIDREVNTTLEWIDDQRMSTTDVPLTASLKYLEGIRSGLTTRIDAIKEELKEA